MAASLPIPTLTSRINAARRAIGDNGADQGLIRTISRKALRFVGEVRDGAVNITAAPAPPSASVHTADLSQEVHFCTAADGVRIAYASVGRACPFSRPPIGSTTSKYDWHSSVWRHVPARVRGPIPIRSATMRGAMGLSDWEVADISLEDLVRDLESVADANGLQKFPLLGYPQGCAVSIRYAVRHPERVSHLILYGGYARGRRRRSPSDAEQADALATPDKRPGWGQENPAFASSSRHCFISRRHRRADGWFNDLQRITTPPRTPGRMRRRPWTILISSTAAERARADAGPALP